MSKNRDKDAVEEAVDVVVAKVESAAMRMFKTDSKRILIGLLVAVFCFYPFGGENPTRELLANLSIVKYYTGFLVVTALVTHLTRRILFPYIRLREYAARALQGDVASAIVVASLSLIIAATIIASVSFFHN